MREIRDADGAEPIEIAREPRAVAAGALGAEVHREPVVGADGAVGFLAEPEPTGHRRHEPARRDGGAWRGRRASSEGRGAGDARRRGHGRRERSAPRAACSERA